MTQAEHCVDVALAEWLRRVPAKYMGFPRESSNLSGDGFFFILTFLSCKLAKSYEASHFSSTFTHLALDT